MSRCLLGQLLADGRRNSAHVDDDQSFSRPFEYTVWPGHDFFDLWRVGQHGNHYIRSHGDSARGGSQFCACVEYFLYLGLLWMTRINCDVMLRFEQVERHRPPHDTDANKTYLHEE